MNAGAVPMAGALWSADFEFRRGHLRVRKTGARVPYAVDTLKEGADWYLFFLVVQAMRVLNAFRDRRGPAICFAPDRPRPWYLVWPVVKAAGVRVVDEPRDADAVFFFEDATRSSPPLLQAKAGVDRVNFHCTDVSKSRVADVFESVFGYPLAVDPTRHDGPLVEKSEFNGAHDGRIVTGPLAPREGCVYQRLIDNGRDDEMVEDLRCPTVLGALGVTFLKRRPKRARFANFNTEVKLSRVEQHFSAEERDKLGAFVRAMRLDWGGLDVLRDRGDGRLYVVDVNKTDMGPPTTLPLPQKLRAVMELARLFRERLTQRGGGRL